MRAFVLYLLYIFNKDLFIYYLLPYKPDSIIEKGVKCIGKNWRRWKSADNIDREELEYDEQDDLVNNL